MSQQRSEKKSYRALYRSWRPQLFSHVVGQEHVTRTLQNALDANRVAHAYLFCGLRGTGKTTMAKLLAKALNCLEGVSSEPCNRCRSCLEVMEGRNMDVLEIDAASNRGIDEIRELREKARYTAAQNRFKVYIIDEVHMLTNEAFNALLKILEEPPPSVVFILATTEVYKLPLTVVSRCQRFDFHLLDAERIARHLRKVADSMGFELDEETLYLLGRQAEGSMRDALGFLEQCRAYGGEKVAYSEALDILGLTAHEVIFGLFQAIIDDDTGAGLTALGQVVGQGKDLQRFLREMILYLRKLVLLQSGCDEEKFLKDVPGFKPYLLQHRGKFNTHVLLEMLEVLQELTNQLKSSSQPQFLLELAFLRMMRAYRFRHYLSPQALLNRLEELEEKLQSAGAGRLAPGQPAGPVPLQEDAAAAGTSGSISLDAEKAKEPPSSLEVSSPDNQGEKAPLPKQEPELSPDQLRGIWQRLLPELKKQRKHNIYALLQEGDPFSCKGGIFTIAFPPSHSFHKGRVEATNNRKYIESMLESLTGNKVSLKVILLEKKEGQSPPAKKNSTSPLVMNNPLETVEVETADEERENDDTFIQEMLELFNGKLIETGKEELGSRDFWSFKAGSFGLEPGEPEEEVPF